MGLKVFSVRVRDCEAAIIPASPLTRHAIRIGIGTILDTADEVQAIFLPQIEQSMVLAVVIHDPCLTLFGNLADTGSLIVLAGGEKCLERYSVIDAEAQMYFGLVAFDSIIGKMHGGNSLDQ